MIFDEENFQDYTVVGFQKICLKAKAWILIAAVKKMNI